MKRWHLMTSLSELLSLYDYHLPAQNIALTPANPRDSSKLVCFDRNTNAKTWTTFSDFPKFIPKNSLLIFNDTKVLPARLKFRRSTGGTVSCLVTKISPTFIELLSPKPLKIGEELCINNVHTFAVQEKSASGWILSLTDLKVPFDTILNDFGETPLPPYAKKSPLSEAQRRERYQSVFAKNDGSIAAPTASLHFTDRTFLALKEKGIDWDFVTLHVNLGTFATLTEESILNNALHEETYIIEENVAKKIEQAKKDHRPIIAIGTTALRVLESATKDDGKLKSGIHTTKLFIRDGYEFKTTTGLLTNFHVPQSSLLMLVSAFAGRENVMTMYRQALEHDFRFTSFGDAMLLV